MKRNNFFIEYWNKPIKERTILKREARLKKRIAKGRYFTEQQEMSAKNSFYRSSLKRRATKAEVIFGDYLWNNKIYFQFQKGFFKPFHRIVDFYLPDQSLIVEIDGEYHNEYYTKYNDNIKDNRWKKERCRATLRITNEEVFNGSFIKKLNLNGNIN